MVEVGALKHPQPVASLQRSQSNARPVVVLVNSSEADGSFHQLDQDLIQPTDKSWAGGAEGATKWSSLYTRCRLRRLLCLGVPWHDFTATCVSAEFRGAVCHVVDSHPALFHTKSALLPLCLLACCSWLDDAAQGSLSS